METFKFALHDFLFYKYISVKFMIAKCSSVTFEKHICNEDEMTVNKASDTELQQDRIKQKV